MKKSYKCLILLGATTLAMGSSLLTVNNQMNKENMEKNLRAYNYNPSHVLENVFIEDKDIILPFIFENRETTITEAMIKAEFKKAGLTVKNISTGTTIGTGTKITVNENSNVYNVVIYGDANGDGKVNLIDAQKIVLHQKEPDTRALTGMYFKAANVSNKDDIVNLIDAQRVVMFQKDMLATDKKILVVEPQSEKELDKTAPVITLKGNASVTVQVGGSYTDAGATATDNYDGDVTGKIKVTSNVDTKKVGTYTVKYNVTDSNGNKATEVVRTVKVVDTVKPVITLNGKATVTIEVGTQYVDAGATAVDNYDGTITSKIVKTGTVDHTKLGTYTITYNVTDTSGNKATAVTRTVNVVDTTKPVITLDSNNVYSMEVGGTKPTFAATANDNYDGTVQVTISDNIQVDTIGTYTVTFTATDSNNNTETITKTFEVTDKVDSIAMASQPNVKDYEYGVTELDLTGAQIRVNFASGTSEDKAITDDMIVKNYDLTVPGNKTITVRYQGKETTFQVNVRAKISAIEVTEAGKENVTNTLDVYEASTKQNFTLGTVQAKQTGNVSTLKESQLKIETALVSSNDSTATAADITVNAVTENGSILLKGSIQKVGTYTVTISMKDDTTVTPVTLTITATKSTQVGEIILETVENGKVKNNLVDTVKKAITIKNISGEEMELLASELIVGSTTGLNITKLDENKEPIPVDDTTKYVKYLEITTSLLDAQEVYISLNAKGSAMQDAMIRFNIGNASVLNNVTFEQSKVEVFTELVDGDYEIDENGDGNVYTVLPITFYNTEGERMNVTANNISTILEGASIDDELIDEQKVCMVLPRGNRITLDDNGNITRNQANRPVLETKLYGASGEELSNSSYTNVAKIGISYLLNIDNQQVVLSTLQGKNIEIKCKNQAQANTIEVGVNYKEISTLKINSTGVTLPSKENGYYVFDAETEVDFGNIQVGDYEGPLTADMLRYKVDPTNATSEVNVKFEEDSMGNIHMKVTALGKTVCSIRPYIEGGRQSLNSISINAKGAPIITDIQITGSTTLPIGGEIEAEIKAISASKPNGVTLKYDDISYIPVEGIDIQILDIDRLDAQTTGNDVGYIKITTTLTSAPTDISKPITLNLFDKYSKTLNITIPANP